MGDNPEVKGLALKTNNLISLLISENGVNYELECYQKNMECNPYPNYIPILKIAVQS